ncbi:hypothetical protein MNBD_GAMMA21-2752, partial [hydrothermal vent metagenome]
RLRHSLWHGILRVVTDTHSICDSQSGQTEQGSPKLIKIEDKLFQNTVFNSLGECF